MAGLDHSSGDVIVPIDADLQNDPADIPRLLQKLQEGYDVVSGWRMDRLSGGIDSATVLTFAARHRQAANLDTFTIGFNEPSFDESAYARAVAAATGTRHHERILDIDLAGEIAPRVLAHRGDELFEASYAYILVVSTYLGGTINAEVSNPLTRMLIKYHYRQSLARLRPRHSRRGYSFSRYVGMEVSAHAIATARAASLIATRRISFEASDLREDRPDGVALLPSYSMRCYTNLTRSQRSRKSKGMRNLLDPPA
jgi:glycosyltransferase involved in cell wall biosynthesis